MEWLRVAILGGGVCLLPTAALADESVNLDHARAEAREGAEANGLPTRDNPEGPPDHARAEGRGAPRDFVPKSERGGSTDHATAESRGAATE
jgi:hypothetical protein